MQSLFIEELLQLFFLNCKSNPNAFISNFNRSRSIIAFNYRCCEKRFTHVSDSFKTILGYNRQNILTNGNFSSKILHPQDKGVIHECLKQSLTEQEKTTVQTDFDKFSQTKCRAMHLRGYWKYFIIYVQGYWNKDASSFDKIGLIVDQRIKSGRVSSFTEVESKESSETGKTGGAKAISSSTNFISPRENEILEMISNGYLTKEIASKLNISDSTVVTHRKNLISKLHVRNTAELIKKAARHMLI